MWLGEGCVSRALGNPLPMKEALGSQAFNLLSAVGTCNPSSCGVIGRLLDGGVMVGVRTTSNNELSTRRPTHRRQGVPIAPTGARAPIHGGAGQRPYRPPRQPLPYAYNMVVGVSVCAADPADDEIDLSVLQ